MKAIYHKGDLLTLVVDQSQACMVVEDQHSNHVKIRRASQPIDEFIRAEDLMVYGGKSDARTTTN